MKTVFSILLMTLISFGASAQKDTLCFKYQGEYKCHDIVYPEGDSVYTGEVNAYFKADPSVKALWQNYYNGKLTGRCKEFFPDGSLRKYYVYGWGDQEGDYSEYNEDGALIIKGQYKDGIKHGYWNYRKIRYKGKYKWGEKHGTWKHYDVNKRTIGKDKYKNGKLIKES